MTKRMSSSALDLFDDLPTAGGEFSRRHKELSSLEQKQTQLGTSIPQLYGSLSRFIANPSTVSVETYKRMLDTDETLGSGIDFMNLCMIARFGDFHHPVPEVMHFVQRALDRMEHSFHEGLDEMLSAEWAGFSVTEPVWNFVNDFDGVPAFIPRRLVTYPPLTIVFSVDRNGNLHQDGIHQYQRYHNTFFNSYTYGVRQGDLDGFRPDLFAAVGDLPYPVRIGADLSYLTIHIPKNKCIHLRSSSTGKFNNPYGRSIFRRAYKSWVAKDAFLKMWIVAADRKGTPLLVGFAAPNDTVLNEQMGGRDGNAQPERADEAMARTFKTIHNSSFIVLPGKEGETYSVKDVQIQGDMQVFTSGLDYYNKMLLRSILIPPLIMGGDGGGSYSLGQEHHKIFSRTIDGKLKPYKQGIISQFISPMIRYNFPESAWKKHGFGEFKIEEYDTEQMEKMATIFATLTDKGYMTPEDQQDMDEVRQKVNLQKKKSATLYDAEGNPTSTRKNPEDQLPPGYEA